MITYQLSGKYINHYKLIRVESKGGFRVVGGTKRGQNPGTASYYTYFFEKFSINS